jgi:NAD(P)-dependent dehydrogenase (short-subunit alcohol dehydrogenase family)
MATSFSGKTILISGGNSGIGLQAARDFLARGHRVVLLGRDAKKGEEALASFGAARTRAAFHSVDLSTHVGVRAAAARVLDENDTFEAVLHSTGVFTNKDVRTSDGLHVLFAVNYLSRYHLTQLLLPALRRAERARVVMMTASVPVSTKIDLHDFPRYEPFHFAQARLPIQVANHHYAAHLAKAEPGLLAGVVNAGAAKTDILRMMPWAMRAVAAVVGPLFFSTVAESALNAEEACLGDEWLPATYWDKPGSFDRRTPIVFDEAVTQKVIEASRALTGI